jgi:RND family efflux transporter MFP subunit
MKKSIKYLVITVSILSFNFLLLTFYGCGSSNIDKKTELVNLKKEHDQLTDKIKKLEKELEGKDDKSTEKIKYVSFNEIKPGEFNQYLEVQGKVDGEENVAVNAKMPGVITKIYVKEGDAVRQGQLLAQIDDEYMQKGLNELKSTLSFATQMYEKQKNLWDQKIGSEVQYLTAKNNKESIENKIATLKDQVDQTKIISPINGNVEDLQIKIGQAVSPGFPVFRVINFSKVKVVAEVAEAYSSRIKLGNDVIIFFPDMNKEVKAKITFSSKYINPTNRTFIVEARLNPKDIDARANMIAVFRINDYKAEKAFIVPINVIQKSSDTRFIFLAKEENSKLIARKQIVTVGNIYNGKAEITSGLKEGDKVIMVGYQDMNEGQLISVNN